MIFATYHEDQLKILEVDFQRVEGGRLRPL